MSTSWTDRSFRVQGGAAEFCVYHYRITSDRVTTAAMRGCPGRPPQPQDHVQGMQQAPQESPPCSFGYRIPVQLQILAKCGDFGLQGLQGAQHCSITLRRHPCACCVLRLQALALPLPVQRAARGLHARYRHPTHKQSGADAPTKASSSSGYVISWV